MAFYVVYFTICVLVSSYTGAAAEFHDPMVLVYYPPELIIYALSDLDTLFSTTSAKYTNIIFLCPSEREIRGRKEAFFKVKKIISSDSVGEMVKEEQRCETSLPQSELRPSIYAPYQRDFYWVTYIISNDQDTKDLLEANGLSDTRFPSIDFYDREDFYEMYGFWIKFDDTQLAPRWTFHHIVDYNTAKKEQKLETCEHSFFDIDGLAKHNILRNFIEQGKFEFTTMNNKLVPHQLVPIDDFTDYYSRLATCTYMNIVPIWQPISEGPLRRIERYIQRLVTKLPLGTIRVRTVAYDALQSPYSWIPIPRLVFKVVYYRKPLPASKYSFIRQFQDDNNSLSMVIVVHNEMKEDGIQKVCNADDENYCEANGWNVTDSNDKYGNVYCCNWSGSFFRDIFGRGGGEAFFSFNLKAVPFGWRGPVVNVAEQLENERSNA